MSGQLHFASELAEIGESATQDPLEDLARRLLKEIGEDPDRDGLKDTPARYARWWREFINYEPGDVSTVFEATSTGQLVIVSGAQVWSLCEHHLLPFNCSLTIAYLSSEKLLGLSKFARIAHKNAHKLQLQERLVADIAADIMSVSGSADVGVIGSGEHLCMTMRGIRTQARMTTTAFHGAFAMSGPLQAELFAHFPRA